MASEPAFRGSLATWRRRVWQWIARSDPRDLLSVDITFDFQPVHGDRAMADALWRDAWEAAHGQVAFLKLLAENAGEPAAAVSFFGRLRSDEDGRIDLKLHGLKDIVTTARALALHRGVRRHATHDRLQGLRQSPDAPEGDLATLDEAHALILDCILRQQLADIGEGLGPTNRVVVATLDRRRTTELKTALARIALLPELRRDMLGG